MLAISKDFEETVSSYFGGEAFSSLKHSSIKYNILLFGKYFIQRKRVHYFFTFSYFSFHLYIHDGVITEGKNRMQGF